MNHLEAEIRDTKQMLKMMGPRSCQTTVMTSEVHRLNVRLEYLEGRIEQGQD